MILLQRIIRTWKNNSYIFEITKTFRSADKNRLTLSLKMPSFVLSHFRTENRFTLFLKMLRRHKQQRYHKHPAQNNRRPCLSFLIIFLAVLDKENDRFYLLEQVGTHNSRVLIHEDQPHFMVSSMTLNN